MSIAVLQHQQAAAEITIDRREVLRYMGHRDAAVPPALAELLESALGQLAGVLAYRACYAAFPLYFLEAPMLDLGFAQVESKSLHKHLTGCKGVLLFVATAGIGVDRLVQKYNKLQPSRALALDAAGSAAEEAYCDAFCEMLAAQYAQKGLRFRPRFSPGYGDFALAHQRDIFAALDCSRRLGISLTDKQLMIPTKSVSAVIGFY